MTRVAVVGAGYFGQFHYDAWSRMDGCELVGLMTRSGTGAAETAAKYGVEATYTDLAEMAADAKPDLVDITAPPETHLETIRTLAPSVKWLICQKPFCRTPDEAAEAIAFAMSHDARIVIHENIRFQPWYRAIKGLLNEDRLGDVYQVTFRLRPGDGQGPNAYMDRQPYFQKMERFLVHETGIHWIDTFRFLLGEVISVSADLRQLNPAIAGEDAGVVQFAFASATRAIFDGNRLADHAAENRRLTLGELTIDGSQACLHLTGEAKILLRDHGSNGWQGHAYDWNDHLFGGDCVYLTNKAALEALKSGSPAETEAEAYLRNLEIEDAVYRSHQERRWIDV
ncbi:MAG: Gfo/Idh/MocA family oxidoreductase [Pseudomonadota bacterium]